MVWFALAAPLHHLLSGLGARVDGLVDGGEVGIAVAGRLGAFVGLVGGGGNRQRLVQLVT